MEPDAKCAQYTARLAALAGLEDRITVVQSTVDAPDFQRILRERVYQFQKEETETETEREIMTKTGIVDFVFIDHDKSR